MVRMEWSILDWCQTFPLCFNSLVLQRLQHSPPLQWEVWNVLFCFLPPCSILGEQPFTHSQNGSSFKSSRSPSLSCALVYLFISPKLLRTGNESCLSLYKQWLAYSLAPQTLRKICLWIKFYYVKYYASLFFFNLFPVMPGTVLWNMRSQTGLKTETVLEGYAGMLAQRKTGFICGQRI